MKVLQKVGKMSVAKEMMIKKAIALTRNLPLQNQS